MTFINKNVITTTAEKIDIPLGEISMEVLFTFLRQNLAKLLSEIFNKKIEQNIPVNLIVGEKKYSIIDRCKPPDCPFTQKQSFSLIIEDLKILSELNISMWNDWSTASQTFYFGIFSQEKLIYKIDYFLKKESKNRLELTSWVSTYQSLMDDARFIRKGVENKTD